MSSAGVGKHRSKAYSSTVAIQSDAAKYRNKYKELKKKCKEIEAENDRMHAKTLRLKRNIQRMRLERALLYEKMEMEIAAIEKLGYTEEEAAEQGGSSWLLAQHGDEQGARSGAAPASPQRRQANGHSRD